MTPLDRQSIITAFGCWLSVLVALALQFEDPWWAAISTWIIANPDPHAVVEKGIMRVCATVFGCWAGYHLAMVTEGYPFAQAAVMFAAVSLGIWGRYTRAYGYAWVLGGLTLAMMLVISMNEPLQVGLFAYYRAYEIMTGVIIGSVVSVLTARLVPDGPHASASTPPIDQRAVVNVAILAGLLSLVMLVAWSYLKIPDVEQVIVSVIAVMAPSIVAMRTRAWHRLIGCLIGGVAGLAVSLEAFWLWSLFFIAGMFVAAHLHLSGRPDAYVGTQAGFAYIMALVTGSGPPDSILPVVERLAGIALGVSLLLVSSLLITAWSSGRKPPEARPHDG